MTRTSRLALLTLVAGLGLAACDDDSTGPGSTPQGSLSFGYQGVYSGSYSATGGLNPNSSGELEWGEFAVGLSYFDANEGENFVDLFSFDPNTSTRGHAVDLFIPAVTSPTTLSLDLDACLENGNLLTVRDGCALGLFVFNANANLDQGDVWMTKTGTLRVEQVSTARMRGTFTGTLVSETGQTITLSNGSFDVPLVDEETLSRLNRSPAPNRISRPQAQRAMARVLGARR